MTDLTKDAPLRIWGEATTMRWLLDSSAAQTVYKGQPMIIDQSEDTTRVRGFVDATVVAATDIFIGIANEGASIAAGAAETEYIEILTEPTIVGFAGSVFTNADVGDTIYMSDSAVLSATAADNPMIGVLVQVTGGFQYVRLSSPAICTGA